MRIGSIEIKRVNKTPKHKHEMNVVAQTGYYSITGPKTIVNKQCNCGKTQSFTVDGILPGATEPWVPFGHSKP